MTLNEKLLSIQQKIGKISKDSTNPFYKSKYFDINSLLEHVTKMLNSEGLVLTQPIKDNCVESVITDTESGESIVSELCLPDLSDPQKIGSCITYYRRYTLQSLLALQSEDDDANLASKPEKKEYPKNDDKAWINDKQVQEACERISKGEHDLIDKLKETFKISKANFAKLVEAKKETQEELFVDNADDMRNSEDSPF